MNENENNMPLTSDIQMLIAANLPNTKYFDSRFDHLQFQTEELRSNQDVFREQLRDLKLDMDRKFSDMDRKFSDMDRRFTDIDRKFSDVDKHFDTSRQDMLDRFNQVDKRFEQVDKRLDETQRDMKERFAQVDKRFEQVIVSIEKLGTKLDKRDEQHRAFTFRMFTLAISISIFGVLGVFIKTLGII